MASGDLTLYTKHIHALFDSDADGVLSGEVVDLDTDTIKLVVLKTGFTPDTTGSTAQEHFDDISSSEVATATAYTGPITLVGITVSEAAGVVKFDATDVTIAIDGSGFTDATHFAIYKDSGTPSTSPLMAIGDLGSARANTVNALVFEWGTGGIFTATQV